MAHPAGRRLLVEGNEDKWVIPYFVEARGIPWGETPREANKARLHAWLAFQDPPGRSLHHAILERILAPGHPAGDAFFHWLVELFDLPRRID